MGFVTVRAEHGVIQHSHITPHHVNQSPSGLPCAAHVLLLEQKPCVILDALRQQGVSLPECLPLCSTDSH